MTSRAHILQLSRLGAAERAWAAFRAGGWPARGDAEARLLEARLLKDRAIREAGEARRRLFRESADAYAEAAAQERSTYALINAASLALLGGDPGRAEERAHKVLAMLDDGRHELDTPYWLGATRAEALLLLRQSSAAALALRQAIAAAPRAWEDHAITVRQFTLLLAEQGGDAGWLDPCRPPPSLHFSGIMGVGATDRAAARSIAGVVEAIDPSAAYGALAAGADILVAEALERLGAELHIVLPCDADRFRAESVAAVGEHWVPRFDRLLRYAASLEVAAAPARLHQQAVDYANRIAMGMAIGEARLLATTAVALGIRGEEEGADPATERWRATGLRAETLTVRRSSDPVPLPANVGELPTAILAVRGSKERAQGGMRHGRVYSFDRVGEAVRAARQMALDGVAVGLDFRLEPSPLGEQAVAAAVAGADAAPEGAVVATRYAAAAARLDLPELDADLIGEVGNPFGTDEMWRLRDPL